MQRPNTDDAHAPAGDGLYRPPQRGPAQRTLNPWKRISYLEARIHELEEAHVKELIKERAGTLAKMTDAYNLGFDDGHDAAIREKVSE